MTAETLSLESALARHLAHLRAQGYTPATVDSRAWILGLFRAWGSERGVSLLIEVTPPIVARYQRHLAQHRKADGQPLSSRTQRTRLVPLRTFGRWAEREKLLAQNPVAELIMPRVGQPLPQAWLSAAEVERILALPNLDCAIAPSWKRSTRRACAAWNSRASTRPTSTLPGVRCACVRARAARIA
jgi:integrase/recombinase XerD